MRYTGPEYKDGGVALTAVLEDEVARAEVYWDVAAEVLRWSSAADSREDVVYFGVRFCGELVGQILLHDIDQESAESLVGYHLFGPQWRRRDIGTAAPRLLQRYVREETSLRRLVIITGWDNMASRRLAAKCDFEEVGPSREEPESTLVLGWWVPQRWSP